MYFGSQEATLEHILALRMIHQRPFWANQEDTFKYFGSQESTEVCAWLLSAHQHILIPKRPILGPDSQEATLAHILAPISMCLGAKRALWCVNFNKWSTRLGHHPLCPPLCTPLFQDPPCVTTRYVPISKNNKKKVQLHFFTFI